MSREYLELLGVRPLLGRAFDASDAGTRAVLLSHGTWMRHYGGDAALVGTGDPFRDPDAGRYQCRRLVPIVGVLPPRLRLPLYDDEDGTDPDRGRGGRSVARRSSG